MATTPVGFEIREVAIAEVLNLRLMMNEALEQITSGDRSLSSVLQLGDDIALNQLYVVKVLESFSNIGKVRARQILDGLEISHQQKMSSLSDIQRNELLEALT